MHWLVYGHAAGGTNPLGGMKHTTRTLSTSNGQTVTKARMVLGEGIELGVNGLLDPAALHDRFVLTECSGMTRHARPIPTGTARHALTRHA